MSSGSHCQDTECVLLLGVSLAALGSWAELSTGSPPPRYAPLQDRCDGSLPGGMLLSWRDAAQAGSSCAAAGPASSLLHPWSWSWPAWDPKASLNTADLMGQHWSAHNLNHCLWAWDRPRLPVSHPVLCFWHCLSATKAVSAVLRGCSPPNKPNKIRVSVLRKNCCSLYREGCHQVPA